MKTATMIFAASICAAAAVADNGALNSILAGQGTAVRTGSYEYSPPQPPPSLPPPPATSRIAPSALPARPPAGVTHVEAPPVRDAAVWPFSMALFPPVQFPFERDDVVGLRLGLPWAKHHIVMGIDIDALVGEATDNSAGLVVAGIYSGVREDMTGIQIAGLVNQAGGCATGAQISGIANLARDAEALQVSLVNVTAGDSAGVQIGLWNQAGTMSGVQIGVVNNARALCGVQIGLSNYVADSSLQWFPIMNVCF